MERPNYMNVAMAYYNGARDQVTRWMTHVAELGGLGNHKLFTMPAFDCDPVPDILPNTRLKDEEQITSDWQNTQPARSAAAPNSMFRQFAWHFYLNKLGPWLFIEPDCVPLVKDWTYILETEYVKGGKPFMGAHVQIERVPEHMSGNGIYPQDTPALAPTIVMHTNWVTEGREYELAFDIAGANEVLPQAHFTNLIQHVFRHKGFKTRAEFDALIDPNAVVFHSNKDGSIYQFLSTYENVQQTPNRNEASIEKGQANASTVPSSGMQDLRERAETPSCQQSIESKISGQMEGKDSSPKGQNPEAGEVREVRESDQAGRPSSGLHKATGSNLGVSDVPHQELTSRGGVKSFPEQTLELSKQLAALADTQYHRRKVRDALKKVGLI